jgi:hypothetical protein
MKRKGFSILFALMLVLSFSMVGAMPVGAAGPVTIHLGPGTITSTSLDSYGTTWGPANDYWFDLSAGLKVTIVGLNMAQVPYTGAWGWPPVPGEDGGSAQLWLQDGHDYWSRHDLTSAANAGGTWDAQGTWAGHDDGFRKYLIQNFHWPGWDDHGSSQYNVEPWKGPRLAPGSNTDGNMGTPDLNSDKFDLEYTYVSSGGDYTISGRHRMYYAASWDEMSLTKPPWPPYKWQWNKAINNVANPEDAWLPFYEGVWTVPGFCGPANLRMAFQNRGVAQSGYWTISWDDIVIEGTPGDHSGPITSDVVATPNPVKVGESVTVTASVDDSTTGGSNIASAEYSLDGGAWTAMDAQDGAFDEVSEDVTVTFTAPTEAGIYDLCVRGTDALCNVGIEECTEVMLVVYDPEGGFVTGGGWIDSPAGAYMPGLTNIAGIFTGAYTSRFTNIQCDPNNAPITFTGSVEVTGIQPNGAVMIGLVDQGLYDSGSSVWETWGSGAYLYLGRIGTNVRIGPSDGFMGGELNQVGANVPYVDGGPNLIEFSMTIYNGQITVTYGGVDYVDTYGGIEDMNTADAYSGSEFDSGAYVGLDSYPANNTVVYDINISGCFCTGPTGKATFGFVAKYKKGADVPDGQTEFVYKAADFNFHSSSYDWLVVTGSDYARFKGTGTINGAGEYKFMLWAGDGTGTDGADTFRIKIWEEDESGNETVIYDNGMDQAIAGGSIVVHTK